MHLLRGILFFIGMLILAAASFLFFYHRGDQVREGVEDVAEDVGEFLEGHAETIRVPLEGAGLSAKPPPRLIYLNREGALLRAAKHDDSKKNLSAVLHSGGLETFEVPAYAGSHTRWKAIKACVQEQFVDYNIKVVDRRPIDEDYIMVMMGGRPGELAKLNHGKGLLLGLTPFSGQVMHDSIVLIFTGVIGHRTTRTCETVSHEVAHAFGVDHSRLCSDVMTYKRSCVKRQSFRDKDAKCGEYKERPCEDGSDTQNSHEILEKALGPAVARSNSPRN
jgi:hypothetical protein